MFCLDYSYSISICQTQFIWKNIAAAVYLIHKDSIGFCFEFLDEIQVHYPVLESFSYFQCLLLVHVFIEEGQCGRKTQGILAVSMLAG